MSSEKILKKSTFGGFKKEGVLNYIEELQTEILTLKKELNNKNADQKEIEDLTKKNKNYENEISTLKAEIADLKNENDELKNKNELYSDELIQARTTSNELELKISVYEKKLSEIEKKFAEIENAYANSSSEINDKASIMMQDAVSYSEKIIFKANETAKASVLKADAAIKNAVADVADASANIKSAHSEYNRSVISLEKSVEKLSEVLSEISSSLNTSSEIEAM